MNISFYMLADIPPYLLTAGGLIGSIALLYFSIRNQKRKHLIDNIPTSKTQGVFIGLVELKGTAECEAPITSLYAEKSCVHFYWTVEEHYRRKSGKNTSSGWEKVAEGMGNTLFYLVDDTGNILIDSEKAEVTGHRILNKEVKKNHPFYKKRARAKSVRGSTGKRRIREYLIRPHDEIYVMGQSTLREDVVAPMIKYDREAPMFMISVESEEKITRTMGYKSLAYAALSTVLMGGLWLMDANINDLYFQGIQWTYPAPFLLFGLLNMIGFIIVTFNALIDLRQRVNQADSNMDVQFKRRHDLIPQLVNVIQGLKQHESEVLQTITALRHEMQSTSPNESGANPQGVSQRVIALSEAYPELKSSENYLKLQRELINTEQKIALARGYYNDIVEHHNTHLWTIPNRWLAQMAGMKQRPFFEAENFERAQLKVNFVD